MTEREKAVSQNLKDAGCGADSIKNPLSGRIHVPEVGELIMDDEMAKGEGLIGK